MPELLPNSIADERFQRLDRVTAARFDGIDRTKLLVMVIDHVEVSALPALAEQLGALGPSWRYATTEQRRELLKTAIERRHLRGTPWAIRSTLAILGHESSIIERTQIRRDGKARYDGTFDHNPRLLWHFWVVVTGDRPRAHLREIVDEWKRGATRGEVYFVPSIDYANDTLMYATRPFGEHAYWDDTFDMTFERIDIEGHERAPDGVFDATFDVTWE